MTFEILTRNDDSIRHDYRKAYPEPDEGATRAPSLDKFFSQKLSVFASLRET
jgi:hypothetical protein